jgi:hypothetical protein
LIGWDGRRHPPRTTKKAIQLGFTLGYESRVAHHLHLTNVLPYISLNHQVTDKVTNKGPKNVANKVTDKVANQVTNTQTNKHANSGVSMADGTFRPIADIQKGDIVLTGTGFGQGVVTEKVARRHCSRLHSNYNGNGRTYRNRSPSGWRMAAAG